MDFTFKALIPKKLFLTAAVFSSFANLSPPGYTTNNTTSDDVLEVKIKDLRGPGGLPRYQKRNFPCNDDETDILITPYYTPPSSASGKAAQKFLASSRKFNTVIEAERCRLIPQSTSQASHQPESVLKRGSPGKDGRKRVNNPSQWFRYRVHGQLVMKFPNDNEYIGSGTLVGPYHVLTAGHNIYSHTSKEEWASQVTFTPARDEDRTPFESIPAALLLSVKGWVDKNDRAYDFGLVVLTEPVGYKTGWMGLLSLPNYIFNLYDSQVTISGYPGDKGATGKMGTQMWMMTHRIKKLEPEQLFYDIDTTPGQSGSGVWSEWEGLEGYKGYHVIGVHAYGEALDSSKKEGNKATRLSSQKFRVIHEWLKSYQGTEKIPFYPMSSLLTESEKFIGKVNFHLSCFKPEEFKDKEVVLFLGPTGSGKTTLLNFIAGHSLEAETNDSGDWVIKGGSDSLKIGHGTKSETFFPNLINIKGTYYCDSPGFGENRGPDYDVAKSYFLKSIADNVRTTKIIVVCDWLTLKAARGEALTGSLKQVEGFISNFDLSRGGFIATKVPMDNTSNHVENTLRGYKYNIGPSKIRIFHAPNGKGKLVNPIDIENFISKIPNIA